MRRSIAISTTPKVEGSEPEVRLFTMSDPQANLFEVMAISLAKSSNIPLDQAAVVIEKMAISMLGGKLPHESLPATFHEMRLIFPILKGKDIRALPRVGCPRGRITALIMTINVPDRLTFGPGVKPEMVSRTVMFKLDKDQADFFNEGIEKVMEGDDVTKDFAWILIKKLVERLLGGADLVDGVDDIFFLRAVGLFQTLSTVEAMALPLASERDVRDWSFTYDRAHK